MSNDSQKFVGSLALRFLLKNPIVLLVLLLVLVIVITIVSSVVIFSGVGNEGINEDDKKLYYTACTEGQINREVFEKMFENAGAFTGKANVFIQAGSRNSVDPVLLASIAFVETGRGSSKMVKERNNPGGLYNSAKKEFFVYDSLDEGILAMASNLNRLYISQGLVSIVQIGNKYAPIGADNDPNNLNMNWVPNVSMLANEFGGLSMNCAQANMGSGEFVHPIPNGRITSGFEYRYHPITGKYHLHGGIDFACTEGKPIFSALGGKVVVANYHSSYGNHVVVNHGDKYTLYAHMIQLYVKNGDIIEQNQVVGACGSTGDSTGPHLHFEVQLGLYSNRQDPMLYLGGGK